MSLEVTLGSLSDWRTGEQIFELRFVPGTVTSWLIDASDDIRWFVLNVHVVSLMKSISW